MPHGTLDGTVIACDRCKEQTISEQTINIRGNAIDLLYPGKARTHGATSRRCSPRTGSRSGPGRWRRAQTGHDREVIWPLIRFSPARNSGCLSDHSCATVSA